MIAPVLAKLREERLSFFDYAIKQLLEERSMSVDAVDLAPGELVESQLDALIEKRARQGDPEPEAAAWIRSVVAYNERQRRQRLWERLRHHEGMMRAHTNTYEAIIRRHRAEVIRCEQLLGIDERRAA